MGLALMIGWQGRDSDTENKLDDEVQSDDESEVELEDISNLGAQSLLCRLAGYVEL